MVQEVIISDVKLKIAKIQKSLTTDLECNK